MHLFDYKGDAHAPAVTDNPKTRNKASPHGSPLGERCQFRKLAYTADIIPSHNGPGFSEAGELAVKLKQFHLGSLMQDDLIFLSLFGFRQLRLMFSLKAGEHLIKRNPLGGITLQFRIAARNFLIQPAFAGVLLILQQPQTSPDDFAGIVVAAGIKLLLDELLVVFWSGRLD